MLEKLPRADSSLLTSNTPRVEDVTKIVEAKLSQGYQTIHDNSFFKDGGEINTVRISKDPRFGTLYRIYSPDSAIYPQKAYLFDKKDHCQYYEISKTDIYNKTGPEIKSIRLIFDGKDQVIEQWRSNQNIITQKTITEKRVYSGNKPGYYFQIIDNGRVLKKVTNTDPNYKYES